MVEGQWMTKKAVAPPWKENPEEAQGASPVMVQEAAVEQCERQKMGQSGSEAPQNEWDLPRSRSVRGA